MYKHGYSKTGDPTYNSWKSVWRRCMNSNTTDYKYYGKRGIEVEDCWKSFEKFLLDMGPRPEDTELDRINNDEWYGPTNCRWATRATQVCNSGLRKDSITGIKGVTRKIKEGNIFVAYVTRNKVLTMLYRGKDFFEACCARKSWESKNA